MRDKIVAIVVIVLAFGLTFLLVCYSLYVLIYKSTLQPPASTTLATAIGGIIGILGAYVGRHSSPKDRE